MDMFASKRQPFARSYFRFLFRIRLCLQPFVEIYSELRSKTQFRLTELNRLLRFSANFVYSHTVRLKESRIRYNDVIKTFLLVIIPKSNSYFCS